MAERPLTSDETGWHIPEWNLRHRLPITRPVGPEIQDCGTLYRMNARFMDVKPHEFLGLPFGVIWLVMTSLSVMAAPIIFWIDDEPLPEPFLHWLLLGLFLLGCALAFYAFKLGREAYFALRRKPVRFHRDTQKLYAIRRRRFFAKPGEGDVMLEVPWNDSAMFCVHRDKQDSVESFFIKYYALDEHGKVSYAFTLGKKWTGRHALPALLAQWNYWCTFMSSGPEGLPKPAIYFQERETVAETFRVCLNDMCEGDGIIWRSIVFPVVVLVTMTRLLALWTSRQPVWPEKVHQVSAVAAGEFDQPSGTTPAGWGETMAARAYDTVPGGDKRFIEQWRGEPDPLQNGLLWGLDAAPAHVSRFKAKRQ